MVLSLLLGALSLCAQQNAPIEVYPVRVNHKMGFVMFYPSDEGVFIDTIIPPRYDYIADQYLPWHVLDTKAGISPYRLFELDARVGVLDEHLNELLPNEYQRIRVLSHEYFALERETLFQLMKIGEGIVLNNGYYQDIYPADADVDGTPCFFVKQHNQWGVIREDGRQLVQPRYRNIELAGKSGFYKVVPADSPGGWQLIDRNEQVFFSDPSENLLVLNTQLVAQEKDGAWMILQRSNKRWIPLHGPLQAVTLLNKRLAAFHRKSDQQIVLWDFASDRILQTDNAVPRSEDNTPTDAKVLAAHPHAFFPWYYPLDEVYSIVCADANTRQHFLSLIDTTGNMVRQETYSSIEQSNKPGVYRVKLAGAWGLVAPALRNELLPCESVEIGAFVEDVAIYQTRNTFGLVSLRNGRPHRMPAVFNQAEHHDSQVWVSYNEGFVVYELNDRDSLAEVALFDSLLLVSSGVSKIREATVDPIKQLEPYEPEQRTFDPLNVEQRGGQIYLERYRRRSFRNERVSVRPVSFRERPVEFSETLQDSFLYLYESLLPIENKGLAAALGAQITGIQFFDLQRDRYVEAPPIIGLHAFDEAYSYTPFMRADGSMGLIDRQGRQCEVEGRPLNMAYIGPFEGGRARACVDAVWEFVPEGVSPPQPVKFQVATTTDMLSDLGIRPQRKYGERIKAGYFYLVDAPGKRRRWGYLNTKGEWELEVVEADYVENFHWRDSSALIYRETDEFEVLGNKGAVAGVIDYQGQILLPVSYPGISRQENYFLISARGTPTFFFNQLGHEVFVNRTRLRPFSEGLAQFRDEEGLWGYVDENGQVAIPAMYKKSRPFSGGLALVADAGGTCQYIHPNGEVAFRTEFSEHQWRGLGDFHEDRCWFKGAGWSWGLFDKAGNVIRPPGLLLNPSQIKLPEEDEAYPLPIDYQNGLASGQILGASGQALTVVLDSMGKVLWEGSDLLSVSSFDEHGLAVFTLKSSQLKGLVNREGKRLCKAQYKQIASFFEGLAAVQAEDQRWGFLRQDGSMAIRPAYRIVQQASEGLIAVKAETRGGWRFIDTEGQLRIAGPFEQVTPFRNGVSLVRQGERASLIDHHGNPVELKAGEPRFFAEGIVGIRQARGKFAEAGFFADVQGDNIFGRHFQELHPFQQGVAKVRPYKRSGASSELGAINRRGVMVVPPKYRNLHVQPDGNIVINPQQFFGMTDLQGNILLAPDYDRISPMYANKNLFRIERGEHIGYILLQNGKADVIWDLQQ